MSFFQFQQDSMVEFMGSDETITTLTTPQADGFLYNIRTKMYLTDFTQGEMKVEVYKDAVLRASSTVKLDTITDYTRFIGWVTFEFSGQPLTAGDEYEVRFSTVGCVADTVAHVYDHFYGNTYNTETARIESPLSFEMYIKEP